MNNPFEYELGRECEEAFRELMGRIEEMKASGKPEEDRFVAELEEGKMLGVLIAEDEEGCKHTLYAFSGQLGEAGFYFPGFVGPVFDYLKSDGYFKTEERKISLLNKEIAEFEANQLKRTQENFDTAKEKIEKELAKFKEECRLSKLRRDARRKSGKLDKEEEDALIRQSQFEKAELRRLKQKLAKELEPCEIELRRAEAHLEAMKRKRHADSVSLQKWLFDNFKVLNARGEDKSLSDIFAGTSLKVPPSGAGECCAPKLLQAAYTQGLKPVEIAEYWYGKPKDGEIRLHGVHYPACRGKCLPVLGWMLQGLDVTPPLAQERNFHTPDPKVLFENEWFCIVDKPSGMLSVPGKGTAMSVQRWLEEHYGEEVGVKVAHRLDQDTSGLLVVTFGAEAYKTMQKLFAQRMVKKQYMAELEGDFREKGLSEEGVINLPLSPDWLDRPRQRVDLKEGKEAVTVYKFIGVSEGRSRVEFYPLTGRTHQLRVHAAAKEGLAMPIAGDRLYSKSRGASASRLFLHAQRISFLFPLDAKFYDFDSPAPF